jgi:hypothetical protein
MLGDVLARKLRSERRRETWRVEALTDTPPAPPPDLDARLEQLEQLRRAGFALAGIEYREGPTPKHVRRTWPVERIG